MINKTYADKGVVAQIADALAQQGFIRLEDFLNRKHYLELFNSLHSLDSEVKKVPDRYSYGLIECKDSIFSSISFRDFLSKVIGKKIKEFDLSVKKFEWKNYTLMHDDESGKEEMRFFFILANKWDSKFGGDIVYLTEDGLGNPIVFPITGNSLCIINKKRDMHSFVKYVNNLVRDSSFILIEGKIK